MAKSLIRKIATGAALLGLAAGTACTQGCALGVYVLGFEARVSFLDPEKGTLRQCARRVGEEQMEEWMDERPGLCSGLSKEERDMYKKVHADAIEYKLGN